MKIRKNAALLSNDEWERYLNAIVSLKHTFPPGSSVSIYDQFVAIHLCVWGLRFGTGPAAGVDGAHGGPAFLPWHREYLRRYELALATVDAKVTLPYWNWGFGEEAETNVLFQSDRMGTRGGNITTGYFAEGATAENPLGWSVHPDLRPFSSNLSRTGSAGVGSLPSEAAVIETLNKDRFSTFRPALEAGTGVTNSGGMHNGVHGWVGGDMGRMTSPNDPIFFMHHAQIDRLWAIWQLKHPGAANYNDLNINVGRGHGLNDNMWPWDGGASAPGSSGFGTDPVVAAALLPEEALTDLVTPAEVLDIEELDYIYDGEETQFEFARTGATVNHDWASVSLRNSYARRPVIVSNMQTFAGADTASVRVRNALANSFQVMVQEERSRDNEIRHVAEDIGYIVGNDGFIFSASGTLIGELATMRIGQPSRSQWDRVFFRHSYLQPVVVAQISSFNGDQAAQIRIQTLDSNFMDLQIEEWMYLDGVHNFEDVSFLVLEAGSHRLRGGAELRCGLVNTNHDWATVNFASSFQGTPVVISQCMTRNGSDPVVTRQRNINADSFEVRLQEEEARSAGGHVNEAVGYIAIA